MTDIGDTISRKITDFLTMTKAMAEAAPRDANGAPQCFACGAKNDLTLVAPGWGGVWECRACELLEAEERAEAANASRAVKTLAPVRPR